jgi:hypothetical protein
MVSGKPTGLVTKASFLSVIFQSFQTETAPEALSGQTGFCQVLHNSENPTFVRRAASVEVGSELPFAAQSTNVRFVGCDA